jgi:hypothetical protein
METAYYLDPMFWMFFVLWICSVGLIVCFASCIVVTSKEQPVTDR